MISGHQTCAWFMKPTPFSTLSKFEIAPTFDCAVTPITLRSSVERRRETSGGMAPESAAVKHLSLQY